MERDAAPWPPDELVGGHIALDFTNTVGGRGKSRDIERLTDYGKFLEWGIAAGLVSGEEAQSLQTRARTQDDLADKIVCRARTYREALHAALLAMTAGADMPESDFQLVEDEIRSSLTTAVLSRQGECLRWQSSRAATDLELPFDRIRLATHELLTSPQLARVRNCERCSWLFLDRGRGKRRRWCSMAACGNRAKAARFYARHK